ncbi:hypothetical protein V8F20_007160 [Naviculisporaceae sp. PSN 640]
MGPQATWIRTSSALEVLRYAYPITIFVYYIVCTVASIVTLQTMSPKDTNIRRRLIMYLMLFTIFAYLAQVFALVFDSLVRQKMPADQDSVVGLLSCILVFGMELALLSDTPKPVWYPLTGSFALAVVFETVIGALSFTTREQERFFTTAEFVEVSLLATRLLAFLVAFSSTIENFGSWRREKATDAERQSLLKPDDSEEQANGEGEDGYGTTSDSSSTSSQATAVSNSQPQAAAKPKFESFWQKADRIAAERKEKALKENGSWFAYVKRFMIFFPYIWPSGRPALQFRIALVGGCLLINNGLNVLIPRQIGIVMDSLYGINLKNPWVEVMIYVGFRIVASSAGISGIRSWLWYPVENYSSEALRTAAYSHVMRLSADFHDAKSSSDIQVAIIYGTRISDLIESVCFEVVPMFIDLSAAFIFLSITFGPYEGFITAATAVVYLFITTQMMKRMKDPRRAQTSAYYEMSCVQSSGIHGWGTVAAFNQIKYEEDRQATAVRKTITTSLTCQVQSLISHGLQSLTLLSGLLAGTFLAIFQVTHGQATPGQFTMLLTYWAQLSSPLTFFASMSRRFAGTLLDAERLLEIMQTKATVVNKEGAPPLEFNGGHVKFENVSFSYDKKKDILKNVSFSVSPGETVAFVGQTGAGKSTILRLLGRLYDVTGGSIKIDGQDIRDVELFSLREQIGVVHQSPVLFDDTIMENVRYAKRDATDEEIYDACKAACIHEQVMNKSEVGYQTVVGERGVKLSGGELQRVAIARAILKKPAVVLLDEATSAVDTETEQKIQEALRVLCKGRTTFVVAHRLSTIMNADRIIVIGDGEVAEQGSHDELIRANGKYADLWSRQVFLKPKDKDSTDSDEEGGGDKGTGIVNDLSTEATKSVMAKVQSTSSSEKSTSDNQAEGSTKNPASEESSTHGGVKGGQSSGHKKENSRLNPDARPFTPRSMAAALSSGFGSMEGLSPTVNTQPGMNIASPTRPPHVPPVQYFTPPFFMFPTAYPMLQHTALVDVTNQSPKPEARREEDSRHHTASIEPKSSSGDPGLKYPVYSRKVLSKSEPFGDSSP